jgi:hypothetical protein
VIRYAEPGATIRSVFRLAPPGLVGTLTVALRSLADDALAVAPTTAGIVEQLDADENPTGNYTATLVVPEDAELGDYQPEFSYLGVEYPDDTVWVVTDTGRAPAPIDYTPTLDDVGALLHARTKATVGGESVETGTFTENSRPSAATVERLIGEATRDVAMRIGLVVPADFVGKARDAATLRAAALVERSMQPEQAEGVTATFTSLRLDYEATVKTLSRNVELALHAEKGLL